MSTPKRNVFKNRELRLLAYPLFLIYGFITAVITGDFYGELPEDFIELVIGFGGFSALIIIVNKRGARWLDYKITNILAMLMLILTGFTQGLYWDDNSLFNPEVFDSTALYVKGIFDLLICSFGIGYVLFSYILNSTNQFEQELDAVSSEIQNSNYTYNISNERIINDTVFGKFGYIINDMIDQTQELLHDMLTNSEYLAKLGEDLTVSADAINNSTENVAFTSQGMASDAASQAELIIEVQNVINQIQSDFSNVTTVIDDNVNTISQIALQTNILALNAGIEASRAGDYGRGFAVVAENVRRLSEETKVLAENIADVTMRTTDALDSRIQNAERLISNVSQVAESNAASSEEVAAAAEEVAATMQQINELSNTMVEISEKTRIKTQDILV